MFARPSPGHSTTALESAFTRWGWGSSVARMSAKVVLCRMPAMERSRSRDAGLSIDAHPTRTFLLPPVSWTFTKRRVYLSLFMARPLLLCCQHLSRFVSICSIHRGRSGGYIVDRVGCGACIKRTAASSSLHQNNCQWSLIRQDLTGILLERTLSLNLGGLRLDLSGTSAVCREFCQKFLFPFLSAAVGHLEKFDGPYRDP